MVKPKIIGLAGTNGSGKDLVGALLAKHHNYWFFSFTELFRAECRKRGIEVTRPNTRMISIEWRTQFGPATLIDRSMQEFEKAGGFKKYDGAVFSSLRNPYEPDRVHKLGGKVLWIDADQNIRYNRIISANRGRGGEDNKTFDQFVQEEYDEMHPRLTEGTAETVLNGAAVKERADLTLINNYSTVEELAQAIKKALADL